MYPTQARKRYQTGLTRKTQQYAIKNPLSKLYLGDFLFKISANSFLLVLPKIGRFQAQGP